MYNFVLQQASMST